MNESTEPATESPEPAPSEGRSRRVLPLALVVLASFLALISVFALWAERQALETDSWVETSTELLEDEEIREALATYLVDQLYENVDVQGEIAAVLPEQVAPLAGPVAGALRQGVDQVARRALEDERVQGLWEQANETAHTALIAVVEGEEGDVVSTADGAVVLDLSPILAEVADRAGIPGDIASKLPEDAATIEVLRSDELEAAQTGVDLFQTVVWIVTLLALGLYALAVFIAGERRREVLRAVGYGFIVVGAIVLIVRDLAGDSLVESLTANPANEPAAANVWSISTSLLAETGGAMVLYGIAIVFSAWLAGPTAIATSTRGAIAPYLRQPRIAYAGAALLLLVIFWWNPTPGTERILPSLLLIALVLFGVEMLRRRTAREFPDRVTAFSAAGLAQSIAARTREQIGRRISTHDAARDVAGGAAAPGAAAEGRFEALERLGELREKGILSEQEFATEKRRLLGDPEQ